RGRKVDYKGGAYPNTAPGLYIAFMLLDDTIHGRQSQSCAMPDRLCRKERLIDMTQRLVVHPATGILECKLDIGPRGHAGVQPHILVIEQHMPGCHRDGAITLNG